MKIIQIQIFDWSEKRVKVAAKVDGGIKIMWVPMEIVYINEAAA